MESHVATRKAHRCDECGRRIPLGARYFSDKTEFGITKEHTNCLDYETEPKLHPAYNQSRSLGEIK